MSNAARVHEFLDKAQVFYFLTIDGDKPKGRPFGFQMLVDDKVWFGTATFKAVYQQMQANPNVEILAKAGDEFLRYFGKATFVKDDALLAKVWEIMPDMKGIYEANGWEMTTFYLEDGHAELHTMMGTQEEFDV